MLLLAERALIGWQQQETKQRSRKWRHSGPSCSLQVQVQRVAPRRCLSARRRHKKMRVKILRIFERLCKRSKLIGMCLYIMKNTIRTRKMYFWNMDKLHSIINADKNVSKWRLPRVTALYNSLGWFYFHSGYWRPRTLADTCSRRSCQTAQDMYIWLKTFSFLWLQLKDVLNWREQGMDQCKSIWRLYKRRPEHKMWDNSWAEKRKWTGSTE